MLRLLRAGATACASHALVAMGPGLRRDDIECAGRVAVYRRAAVRITNDIVSRRAVAEPVKRSVTRPSVGSFEKVIATTACGFTKCCRIKVRSASPNTVTDIDVLALGASMITRSQSSLSPLEAARRAELAIMPPWLLLAITVVTSLTAMELRDGVDGRALRGIGALAATMLERSTGETAAGA